jgi:hypothetical protein
MMDNNIISKSAWTRVSIHDPDLSATPIHVDLATSNGWSSPTLEAIGPGLYQILLPASKKSWSFFYDSANKAEWFGKLLKAALEKYNELHSSKKQVI